MSAHIPLIPRYTYVAVLLQLLSTLERLSLALLREGRVLPTSELEYMSHAIHIPSSSCSIPTDHDE